MTSVQELARRGQVTTGAVLSDSTAPLVLFFRGGPDAQGCFASPLLTSPSPFRLYVSTA